MKYKKNCQILAVAALLAAAASVPAAYRTPTIDGLSINATNNGPSLALQTATPGFGANLQLGQLYVTNDGTNLYVSIAGNSANGGNGIFLFIDSVTGGASEVATNTAGGYGEFDDLAIAGGGVMPASFNVDMVLNLKSPADSGSIGTWDLGTNAATYRGNTGTYTGGFNAAIDNTNATSTPWATGTVSSGIEIQIPLSAIGNPAPGSTIKLFAIAGDNTKNANTANYFSNQVIPNSGTPTNFGNDGAGGGAGNGLSYNGTGGPTVVPASFVVSAAPSSTVTVDPTNGSPNNYNTFSSLMAAIHSFQASGKVNVNSGVTTDGSGIGVNAAAAGPHIINIVNSTVIDEVVNIDERVASTVQNVQTTALIINGPGTVANAGTYVAPGAGTNAILALRSDGTVAAGMDYFEIRTDANITLNNITVIPSATTPASDDLMTLDRLTPNPASPSVITLNGCILTAYTSAGVPAVVSKLDALTDKAAAVTTPASALDDAITVFPDAQEAMVINANDSIFGNYSALGAAAPGPRDSFIIAEGIMTAPNSMTYNINSCVLGFTGRHGIQIGNSGTDLVAAQHVINITGTNVGAGPIDGLGGPTVISGVAVAGSNNIGDVAAATRRYVLNVSNTIASQAGATTTRGFSLSSRGIVTLTDVSIGGVLPIVYGFGTESQNVTWTRVSTNGTSASLLGDLGNGSTLNIVDSVFKRTGTATGGVFSVFGAGTMNVNITHSRAFPVFGGTTATVLGTNTAIADPGYLSTDLTNAGFLDVQNTGFATANSTSGPLEGGTDYVGGLAPAAVSLVGSTLAFGNVNNGNTPSDNTTVSIANSGGVSGLVTLAKSGTDAALFGVTPTGAQLVPPGGFPVTVTFSPVADGSYTAQIDVTGGATGTVALTGSGVTPSSVNEWMILSAE